MNGAFAMGEAIVLVLGFALLTAHDARSVLLLLRWHLAIAALTLLAAAASRTLASEIASRIVGAVLLALSASAAGPAMRRIAARHAAPPRAGRPGTTLPAVALGLAVTALAVVLVAHRGTSLAREDIALGLAVTLLGFVALLLQGGEALRGPRLLLLGGGLALFAASLPDAAAALVIGPPLVSLGSLSAAAFVLGRAGIVPADG